MKEYFLAYKDVFTFSYRSVSLKIERSILFLIEVYVYHDKGVSLYLIEVYFFHNKDVKSFIIEAYIFYNTAVKNLLFKCISSTIKAYRLSDQEYLFHKTEVDCFLSKCISFATKAVSPFFIKVYLYSYKGVFTFLIEAYRIQY